MTNIRQSGTIHISVQVSDSNAVDPDIHLLWGDEASACLARGHQSLSYDVGPGRYVIVVDTWVNGQGDVLSGPYELSVHFQ